MQSEAGNLAGKVALITGGGSGIGAAIARVYAAAGARVVIAGRRAAPLESVAAAIAATPPVWPITMDIADLAQVTQVVDRVIADLGRIDILVCNAGVNIAARRLAVLSPGDWQHVLDVNATGTFNVIHAVLPHMRAHREGLVISIASIAGIRPSPLGGAAYSAAKHAMVALTRVLEQEESANGIRASVILPGEVDTPILDQRPEPVSAEHRARILQPDDIAAAALFVASLPPRASVPELVIKPATQPFS